MTEAEAKTKWRPMARHFNAQYRPCGNSFAAMEPSQHTKCIGSACMMFRWDESESFYASDADELLAIRERPRQGYCGLAGKP